MIGGRSHGQSFYLCLSLHNETDVLEGLVAGFAEGAASTGDAPTVPHAVVQFVPEFESTLFKKPCNRSLNPAGTSKMRSSPVMTSSFRVLSYTAVHRRQCRSSRSILG